MFPQQPQQQFRATNANVQLFYRDSTWTKPPGCSQIYMMLIGGGANSGGAGGGSGAVTTWWGSAQNVPDSLVVSVSTGNSATTVDYQGSNGLNTLLTAAGGSSTTGGAAMTANQFTASGVFQSIAGQSASGTVNASSSTFLSAGPGTAGSTVTANYGYTSVSGPGYFQLQPIIVGVGSGTNAAHTAAIGCSANSGTPKGGPGLVIIAAW